MMLEFPADPACAHLDRQYMLGPSLLVAPIFAEDGTVSYYLPPGRWTSLLNGAAVEGGRWRSETHGYLSLPLMVRPNSIIAVGSNETRPDYDYGDGVCFHVFEPADGVECVFALVSEEGREEAALHILREARAVTITRRDPEKPWSVCLRNVTEVSGVDGGSFERSGEGVIVRPGRGIGTIRVTL